ncbi:MAG TPA: Flp pilus assembly protein CpaB [Actinomycetota bacterium]|nr:Flp pilus assembly protein CpaB [Actinomycetota bacterium]
MRRRPPRASRALVALSLAVAGGATVVLHDHLERLTAAALRPGPGTPVVVATAALPRGATLGPKDLSTRELPARFRPPGALTAPEQAAGRILAAALASGEVVTWTRLAPVGGPVASMVPAGLRAVPVTAPLPPGTVAEGDRVDVLATYAGGRTYTETVIQAAEVLRVSPPAEQGGGTTVLLLVDPEGAERLAYARAFGDLALSVVPPPAVEGAE